MNRFLPWRLCDLPAPTPREEIVEGLLAKGELAILAGQPGAGKTAIAVHLTQAITTGAQFLGRNTSQGDVIYIAAERSGAVKARFHTAECDRETTWLLDCSFKIVDEIDPLISGIKQSKAEPTLIVMDTLARVIVGVEENSATEMGKVMQALDLLVKAFPTAAIVVIHHTGKSSNSTRGSSAAIGAVDLELRAQGLLDNCKPDSFVPIEDRWRGRLIERGYIAESGDKFHRLEKGKHSQTTLKHTKNSQETPNIQLPAQVG